MVNDKLVDEIKIILNNEIGTRFLLSNESQSIILAIEKKYVRDPSRLWWWESLVAPSRIVEYSGANGLEILQKLLKGKGPSFCLAITNDQRPPWPIIEGPLKSIITILQNTAYFEFFIVDQTLSWIVFDTHHNTFVVVGQVEGDLGI